MGGSYHSRMMNVLQQNDESHLIHAQINTHALSDNGVEKLGEKKR